jgi:hypothetical protein
VGGYSTSISPDGLWIELQAVGSGNLPKRLCRKLAHSVVGISGLQGGEEKDTYPFICCPFAVTVAISWILIPEFTLLNSEIYDTMDR